ncbi:chloroplastic import inner membrane translocase subunit HP30-2-like [Papaver somniferum]|uniref:chloroplastic import inner membrane translocase subunit HP30-2-like n=1 Tax=Papaver somniferum TaxID=3469 RepID=UPI000E6F99D5|nr:chloroplastic import inner membrane translocase subunit HP30-2-like [Papaver somniferum]XP_026453674.1 chloroplastic import inner membrane translocase subunit HP30-2-like [Papaver somniferum]
MSQARLFAAMGGARASITCIMKRIRGKEDLQARMAAGFGAGVTLKLMMTPMSGPDVAVNAAIVGVIGAIVGGTTFQKKFAEQSIGVKLQHNS